MKKLIHEINSNLSALISLTEANLKTTVATTRLGWLWWIINPLLMMVIYYLFMNVILARGGDNYHLFILTGLIAWQFFSASLTGTTGAIVNNQQLIKQVALPIPMLIMIPVLVQMVFAVIGFAIIILWNYNTIGMQSIMVIPLILITGMVSYAFGLFLSVLNVYVFDTSQMLGYILRMGFFLTPILFPAGYVLDNEKVPQVFKFLFHINPMAIVITAFRSIVLDGVMCDILDIFTLTVCIIVLIQIGLHWVRLNSSRIVKML